MAIDRDKARSWSRDRIKEELADLRRRIVEYENEINDTESKMDDLAEDARTSSDRYRDHEKTLDAMESYRGRQYGIVGEIEAEIEFLKALLDGDPGKIAAPSRQEKPPQVAQPETPPKIPPRGRPGVDQAKARPRKYPDTGEVGARPRREPDVGEPRGRPGVGVRPNKPPQRSLKVITVFAITVIGIVLWAIAVIGAVLWALSKLLND